MNILAAKWVMDQRLVDSYGKTVLVEFEHNFASVSHESGLSGADR
jgi:hypothetical protein